MPTLAEFFFRVLMRFPFKLGANSRMSRERHATKDFLAD